MSIIIYGGGVVGGGVIEILQAHKYKIKYLIVKNIHRQRDFKIPDETIITDDWNKPIFTPEDIIIEVMGGDSKELFNLYIKWLNNGNKVVSANKNLIAKYLTNLYPYLLNGQLGSEAAVVGGLPLMNTVKTHFHFDNSIETVMGLFNGTSNFILSSMAQGASFESALKIAQEKGYAESDPTNDVEGIDAECKLKILSSFMSKTLSLNIPKVVYRNGISQLEQSDYDYIHQYISINHTIKHMCYSNGSISFAMCSILNKTESKIATTDGVRNCVVLKSRWSDLFIEGDGAGRWPTASSVVADVKRPITTYYVTQEKSDVSNYDHNIPGVIRTKSSLTNNSVNIGDNFYTIVDNFTDYVDREDVFIMPLFR